jgi:hypothetical protein
MTADSDSDFDARLRARIQHLDAAIPVAPAPVLLPSRQQPRRRGRRLVPLLAAAALLIGAGVVGAQVTLHPDNPEPELEAALGRAWAGVACMSPEDARRAVQAALNELGKADWTIANRPGVGGGTGCTFPGVIAPLHEVALFPGAGAELSAAIETLAQELLDTCLKRSDAMALLSSVLVAHGVTEFDISADPWGPQGGPMDQIEAYEAHVADGCFVYVGSGGNAEGKPQYYLWGNWP